MAIGRPLSPLTVSAEQREQLQSWSRRAKTAQALALRSRIVLLAADGVANKEIARRQGCSQPTAGKWRQRFLDCKRVIFPSCGSAAVGLTMS